MYRNQVEAENQDEKIFGAKNVKIIAWQAELNNLYLKI